MKLVLFVTLLVVFDCALSSVDINTVLKGDIFEGDIHLGKSTKNILRQLMSQPGVRRDTVADPIMKWPNGRLPYKFAPDVSDKVKKAFHEAIDEFKNHTCIKIVPRTTEPDYIYVVPKTGCWSDIGRVKNRQELSLGRGCRHRHIVIHELMHALGFFHEHNRLDRDDYITIHRENIIPRWKSAFLKYSHGAADTLGLPYDYGSIMHYGSTAFSRNNKKTIVPKDPTAKIGYAMTLSAIDIKQINKLYNCEAPTDPTLEPCVDKRTECGFYAAFDGYCTYNKSFMSINCRKSCSFC